jgi:uncharacterized protein (TIGR03084 family)
VEVHDVAGDLQDEHAELRHVLVTLPSEQWTALTPGGRWTVADQVRHLAFFDDLATTAITDHDRYGAELARVLASAHLGAEALEGATLGRYRALGPAELIDTWWSGATRLAGAAKRLDPSARVEWFGPSMGAASFLTARLMETWAHGQDVRDAVGIEPMASTRLRHIAQLGVITRTWSYRNRGLVPPDDPVRVELRGRAGETWTWGPVDAEARIMGRALDFCLVVTQRRHVDDTALVAHGRAAHDWLTRAQAFAGPPTDGPRPRDVP